MRTLVHLSDLHFGRVDRDLIEPLAAAVARVRPDVIAISGDLTQRARACQFKEARAFLDRLSAPKIIVPGNHDVPLYNVLARFVYPLANYRRYIGRDLMPFYADEEIAVLGINTARSLTTKYGRINRRQLANINARLCPLPNGMIKVLVTHHPIDLPAGCEQHRAVGRASLAMQTLAECRIDILLAGHLHTSHTGDTAANYPLRDHAALLVQSGTALSTRGRGELNSFSVIHAERGHLTVERYQWRSALASFESELSQRFSSRSEGWRCSPAEIE